MFKASYFASGYWNSKTFNNRSTSSGGGDSGGSPVYDTSGRGGFNRGQGGPGSSYGLGGSSLAPCPICNCYRSCPS